MYHKFNEASEFRESNRSKSLKHELEINLKILLALPSTVVQYWPLTQEVVGSDDLLEYNIFFATELSKWFYFCFSCFRCNSPWVGPSKYR